MTNRVRYFVNRNLNITMLSPSSTIVGLGSFKSLPLFWWAVVV